MNTYATLLSTDDYLDGTLVLNRSLLATAPQYGFVVYVTGNVSAGSLTTLSDQGIRFELIESWPEPTRWSGGRDGDPHPAREWRWRYNHSKLGLFGMTQYTKIVFLDSDLLVLRNIDELFQHPHMSAVNAGGHLPEFASWREPNSGVPVIEPSAELKAEMLDRFGEVEFTRGGDQEFLHAFYPSWPDERQLHLDYRFNVFHTHLDRYHELFGLTLDDNESGVRVVHFYAAPKPWEVSDDRQSGPAVPWRRPRGTRRPTSINSDSDLGPLATDGLGRWRSVHAEIVASVPDTATGDSDPGPTVRSRSRDRWRKRLFH